MLKWKSFTAVLALCTASSASAITQYCDDPESPLCGGTTTTSPAPIGPLYIFGTFNTRPSILVVDVPSSKLCDLNLLNCRTAYGIDALKRGREFSVAQLLSWDRSGAFAINTTEIIACFAYFDSPSAAYFSCQTASRTGLTGYQLDLAATSLGWRAYTGAGLTPQSTDKVNALYTQRKRVTAYAVAYGTLPPDRMHALETEGENGTTTTTIEPAPVDAIVFETVEVTGSKERLPVTPPPGVTILPNVQLVPVSTNPGRTPEIVIDPCVTFQACANPPPPLAPNVPPPICSKQCAEQLAIMQAVCERTSKEVGKGFGLGSTGAAIITGFASRSPQVGMAVFKWTGVIGGTLTAGYFGACTTLNTMYSDRCLEKARQNGC